MTEPPGFFERVRRLLPGEPIIVLAPLMLVQWIALGVFVLEVRHNGWLFYQGGDQTFFYTASLAISDGHVPKAAIGYGWSYLLSPLALAVGPNLVVALPAIVLVQTLVLLPLALYCVYAITSRIGGRRLGYLAAALWVAAPYAAIPLWDHSYHAEYVEQFLPQAFGLTGLGDFPSMVCLLVAALLCIRALDAADPLDGALGGVAAGFAIAIKPANALFLAGPVLAFLAARRFRVGLGFAVALVPSLVALALWKYRGLGYLPIVTEASERLAAPATFSDDDDGLPPLITLGRYLDLDWSRLGENYADLRALFFGVPLWQSLPVLGLIALARALPARALLLGGWLIAFLLVKGSSGQASIDGGTLLRLFMPGFPPLLLLTALVPLLFRGRLRERVPVRSAPTRARKVVFVAAIFTLVPLLLFTVLPPLRDRTAATYFPENVMVPVDEAFTITARQVGEQVLLSWQEPSSPGVRGFYRVFRSRPSVPAPEPLFPPGREGIRCVVRSGGYAGAADCALEMSLLGETRSSEFRDTPPAGQWVYRVGLAANWEDNLRRGDVLLLSTPARITAST